MTDYGYPIVASLHLREVRPAPGDADVEEKRGMFGRFRL